MSCSKYKTYKTEELSCAIDGKMCDMKYRWWAGFPIFWLPYYKCRYTKKSDCGFLSTT